MAGKVEQGGGMLLQKTFTDNTSQSQTRATYTIISESVECFARYVFILTNSFWMQVV